MVSAFCFTLLHSLWQGLVFAVITGVVMVLTRHSRAVLRYNCLLLLLGGFLVTTGITFWLELNIHQLRHPVLNLIQDHSGSPGNLQLVTITQELATSNLQPVSSNQHSFWENWAAYFTTHASLVVLVWCILFCARMVQLLASLAYIQRVKHYKTALPPAYWNEQLALLTTRLSLQKQVRLLESGIVKVPLVVGWLKPVILVPLGLLTSLPADEMEAILLHELAHIQRRDYLVNLLQNFVQAIFFFNPAVIWISALIREERENCCDDMAIAATNNRKQFVQALVAFQEYNLRNTRYAMTFPGKKHHLLNRVKRIVHNRNKTLNTMEKSLLSLGIAAAIVFSMASARNIPIAPVQQSVVRSQRSAISNEQSGISDQQSVAFHRTAAMIPPAAMQTILVTNDTLPAELRDTLPAKYKKTPKAKTGGAIQTEGNGYTNINTNTNQDGNHTTVTVNATTNDKGMEYSYQKVDGNLAWLKINGESIPAEEWSQHQLAIDNIELAQHRNIETAIARQLLAQKQQAQAIQMKRQQLAIVREYQKDQRQLQKDRMALQVETKKDNASIREMQSQQMTEALQKRLVEQKKQLKELELRRDSVNRLFQEATRKMVWQKDSVWRLAKAEEMKKRAAADKERMEASAAIIRNIINDLAKENIMVNIDHSWFGLDDKQFVVDGKPITGEVYEKFKTKYLKNDGMGYYYGPVQVHGRGLFMDKESLGR